MTKASAAAPQQQLEEATTGAMQTGVVQYRGAQLPQLLGTEAAVKDFALPAAHLGVYHLMGEFRRFRLPEV